MEKRSNNGFMHAENAEPSPKKSIPEAIHAALGRMAQQLAADDFKMSVSDFIRLLQFQNELKADGPKEVVARWEAAPTIFASEE